MSHLEDEHQEVPLDLSTGRRPSDRHTPEIRNRTNSYPTAPVLGHPVPAMSVPVFPLAPLEVEVDSPPDPTPLYDEEYELYRLQVLAARDNVCVSNPRMRRNVRRKSETQDDDPRYKERRASNNESAKRSRDQRKLNEVEIQIRVSYLKQKRLQLLQTIRERQRELEYM